MATTACTRCNETKEGLTEPPTGGTLGQTIMERICAPCWEEWRATSSQIINHYGLNLGAPDHRQELRRVMKEFLGIEQARSP